jgi:hypothetical protein
MQELAERSEVGAKNEEGRAYLVTGARGCTSVRRPEKWGTVAWWGLRAGGGRRRDRGTPTARGMRYVLIGWPSIVWVGIFFFFKIYKINSECNFCFLKLAQSKVNGPSLLGSADFASISLYGHNLL